MSTESVAHSSPAWLALLREHARRHAFAALGLMAGFALMMVLDTTLG